MISRVQSDRNSSVCDNDKTARDDSPLFIVLRTASSRFRSSCFLELINKAIYVNDDFIICILR